MQVEPRKQLAVSRRRVADGRVARGAAPIEGIPAGNDCYTANAQKRGGTCDWGLLAMGEVIGHHEATIRLV